MTDPNVSQEAKDKAEQILEEHGAMSKWSLELLTMSNPSILWYNMWMYL